MARDALPLTPRRSQRFQPTATPSATKHDNILECGWSGNPIYVRQAKRDLDLLPDELDSAENDEDEEELETVFYDEFRLKKKTTSYRGSTRMKIAKAELQTYRVGSTVMVETDIMDLRKRPPSIGVIVAMWQLRTKGEDAVDDPAKMRIRIHWFLRPSEMAAVRANRQTEEVRSLCKFIWIALTKTCRMKCITRFLQRQLSLPPRSFRDAQFLEYVEITPRKNLRQGIPTFLKF